MNKRTYATEIKVGIVVLIGIAILFYMSFRVDKYGILSGDGYELSISVDNAGGLDVKTPVHIAGVEVGKIKEITLEGYKAKAILTIKSEIKVPTDSVVEIKTLGVLGDKIIEIMPGSSDRFLASGETIREVKKTPDFGEVFVSVQEAAKNFGDTMGGLKELLGEEEKTNIKKSIENIEVTTRDFRDLLKENKDGIGRIVDNADETFAALKTIMTDIEEGKGTLGLLVKDDSLYKDAKGTLGSLKTITADIEEGKGTIGKLVKDDTLYSDAKEAVKNIKEITEGINKGEGTLGKLAKDESLYNEAEKTMKKVQKGAEGLQEMTPITILGSILGLAF